MEDGGLDGAAQGTVEEPKDALGKGAADDVDDEVSCHLDGHTGEESCVGSTSRIAGGGIN